MSSGWAAELARMELDRDRLAAAVLTRCRQEEVEPLSSGQIDRVVASALRQFEQTLYQRTLFRLDPAAQCLEDLVAEAEAARGGLLTELKTDPGQASLDTLLLQQVLTEPAWAETLADADCRGLSPLCWSDINPYGRFWLDMDRRLDWGEQGNHEDVLSDLGCA